MSDLAGQLPDCVVVDCRFDLLRPDAGAEQYRAGHVPGAHYAHLDRDLAAPAQAEGGGRHPLPAADDLARCLGHWGLVPDRLLVAYDDTGGGVAARLWWLARWLGHARVAVLDGGWPAWQAARLPVTTELPAVQPNSSYPARAGSMPTVDANTVAGGLSADAMVLLDARARDRFAGRTEPLDRIAGHVPGALNVPFQDNLTAGGRFRDPAELRKIYTDLLGDQGRRRIACMCGSGVTACHTVLALERAGLGAASLYVGSWSDWISSAQREVAQA